MAELNGLPASAEARQALGLANYGHFTSMRVEDQRIRGLSRHLDRLTHDCRALFDADLDRERVRELIRHAVAGEQGSFIVRVTIFDPNLEFSHPDRSSRAAGASHPNAAPASRPQRPRHRLHPAARTRPAPPATPSPSACHRSHHAIVRP
jgi:branched-subunit amino acid aminotransferase/4-amino-4-deoxychorismate lyase